MLTIVAFNLLSNNNYNHMYVEFVPCKLKHKLQMQKKTHELPEDGQQLRPKHVGALINKRKRCATSWR
jgi:hypothetical protein